MHCQYPNYGRRHTQENLQKMSKAKAGVNNNHSKLTETDVREIIKLCETHNQSEVARLFKISPNNVNTIFHRKSWKHLVI